MERKVIIVIVLALCLASILTRVFTVALVVAGSPSVIPNSGFEEGILGEVPTHWTEELNEWEGENPPAQGTFEHDLSKSNTAYFEGSYSLYGRAAFIHTFNRVNNPTSETWAHSEYINAGSATNVTVYMRNIARIRPSSWGWNSYIFLKLSDGVGQHNYHLYEYREYPTGQTLEVNNYNFTALGADGQTWYGYTREIPSALNKTHLRVSIGWRAHTWYWYSPASVDISSYVDSVTISAIQYELTVTSSPITGITFTINGTPQTTPYTEWLLEGSYTLQMPETYNGYVWSHWLEDGDTNRTKTIYLQGTTWTGGYKPKVPVGGVSVPINKFVLQRSNKQLLTPWIGLASLAAVAVVSILCVKRRKKQQS